MTKFLLMRMRPGSKLFGEWRVVSRHHDFDRAIAARKKCRRRDAQHRDAWEYMIITV